MKAKTKLQAGAFAAAFSAKFQSQGKTVPDNTKPNAS
jgi:hypothetical protein